MRLLLAAALFATAATPALAEQRGFPVSAFDRVRSSGPFDVHIHTGQAASVHANGPKNVLDRLDIGARGSELIVGTKRDSWWSSWRGWGHGNRAVIDVTVPMVTGVALSGPGEVTVDRVRTRSFTASLSGPGDMTIGALEARDADIHLSAPATSRSTAASAMRACHCPARATSRARASPRRTPPSSSPAQAISRSTY